MKIELKKIVSAPALMGTAFVLAIAPWGVALIPPEVPAIRSEFLYKCLV